MNGRDRFVRDSAVDGDAEPVTDHELSPALAELVADYEAAVGDRDRFLWKWLDHLLPEITLSPVDPDRRKQVRRTKFVATMFVVLLDDLAEKRRDRATFEQASKIPFDHHAVRTDAPGVDAEYVGFSWEIWRRFERELAGAGRIDEFEAVLEFDLKQNLTAIDYASLANEHLDLVNLEESTRYGGHNMMLLTYADVDIMHASSFSRGDLADLRRLVLTAQEMLRIGNWLATWEREVSEGDFSSGVLVYALQHGIVSPDELYRMREPTADPERLVETIDERRIERRFDDRYEVVRDRLAALGGELETVDADAYVDGIERAMAFYLGTGRRL